jgi:hypothetical protein
MLIEVEVGVIIGGIIKEMLEGIGIIRGGIEVEVEIGVGVIEEIGVGIREIKGIREIRSMPGE